MTCSDCNRVDTISMAAHETIMAREDKKNRRLIWVVVLLIVALVATNIAWLVTWNSYDFVTETEEIAQDGRGINVGGYTDAAYRRRDSMGRYSREGGSYERGYAEASSDMNDMLDGLTRQARTEEERQTIREMMEQLKARS